MGASLLTEVFGMGNGLRAYVSAILVDYATAKWLLAGAVPGVVVGDLVADAVPASILNAIFGAGLLVLAGFLFLVRSPEECEPGDRASALIDEKSQGKGTTVVRAKTESVYEIRCCCPCPA